MRRLLTATSMVRQVSRTLSWGSQGVESNSGSRLDPESIRSAVSCLDQDVLVAVEIFKERLNSIPDVFRRTGELHPASL